ncbi:MAG: hypothetical protein ACHP7O_07720 [Burkholderiales bacterium]
MGAWTALSQALNMQALDTHATSMQAVDSSNAAEEIEFVALFKANPASSFKS